MNIINPDKRTFLFVKDFLKPYESKCVLLSSYVRRQSSKVYVLTDSSEIKSKNDIIGVIYIDSTLFHCIPNTILIDSVTLLHFIMKKTEEDCKKIKCISGDSKGTDYFLNLLKVKDKKAFQINKYQLMTAKASETDLKSIKMEPLSDDDNLIRCTENEMEELFSLQKKYLKEEVAPKGKDISDLEVSMTLRQILKNQLCLAVFSDGDAVSKANTNAIGINWIQIGGVYTHPLYRRNGYACQLVYSICRRAMKVNKNVALFVKESNIPAIKLYEKTGFLLNGHYKIAYF